MNNGKGVLQKISLVSAVVCFVLALISGVMLYFRLDEPGVGDPVTASFLASTFFFIFVGVVLTVIGKTNLPSFKFDNSEDK